jgi:hypothetical protein
MKRCFLHGRQEPAQKDEEDWAAMLVGSIPLTDESYPSAESNHQINKSVN